MIAATRQLNNFSETKVVKKYSFSSRQKVPYTRINDLEFISNHFAEREIIDATNLNPNLIMPKYACPDSNEQCRDATNRGHCQ